MFEPPFANIKSDTLFEFFPELGVRSVRGFAELDSTNSWAIDHSNEFTDDQLPLLAVCDKQTAGRGRLGRNWHADTGTLTFSILDSPARLNLKPENVSKLALITGLSVAEAIEASVPPLTARIKWPNDVMVSGRKVAGVLIENVPADRRMTSSFPGLYPSSSSQEPRVVIGVGVNVSTDFSAAAAEVQGRAGSLVSLSGRALDRGFVLTEVLQRLCENLTAAPGDSADLGTIAWSSTLTSLRLRCYLTGQRVRLSHGGRQFTGQCQGINNEGELVLETTEGVLTFQSGEAVRAE